MISFLNYTKLGLWSYIYYKQEEKSETVFKIILKNIKKSGCVVIKLIQWLLPKIEAIYDIDIKDPSNKWFLELEELYDNCNHHSLEYTKKVYKKNFNTNLDDDYLVNEVIASGSIGQVYKVTDKLNNETFAMKSLHPNVKNNLGLINLILKILYSFPLISKIIRYYLPIEITDFIRDFKIQTNLINEANNCMFFRNNYKNDNKFIIPEIKKVSEDIIVMSYEEGESFDGSDISDYQKEKAILLLKIWVKNNQYICRYMHGDLHKGNWRIRYEGNELKLVLYDFGYCWSIPSFIRDIDTSLFIDKSLITPIISIENYIKACQLLIDKKAKLDTIKDSVKVVSNKMIKRGTHTEDTVYDDPIFLVKILIDVCRKNDFLIGSFALSSIILHTQTTNNLKKYDLVRGNRKNNYFEKCILDIINYCETFDICNGYSNILKYEYDKNKISKNEIFESVLHDNVIFNNEKLKELAIYKTD